MKHIDDIFLADWCLPAAAWCRLKSVDDMKWSESDPCMAVRAEETGLSMLTMPSEASTGNEEWASDCSLWFTATSAFHPRCSLVPFIVFLPQSPLYFSFSILSFSHSLRADKGMQMTRAGVDCWADGLIDKVAGDAQIKETVWCWKTELCLFFFNLYLFI